MFTCCFYCLPGNSIQRGEGGRWRGQQKRTQRHTRWEACMCLAWHAIGLNHRLTWAREIQFQVGNRFPATAPRLTRGRGIWVKRSFSLPSYVTNTNLLLCSQHPYSQPSRGVMRIYSHQVNFIFTSIPSSSVRTPIPLDRSFIYWYFLISTICEKSYSLWEVES